MIFEKNPRFFLSQDFCFPPVPVFLSVIVMFVAVGKIINNLLGNLNFKF